MKVTLQFGTILATKFGEFRVKHYSRVGQEGVCLTMGRVNAGAPLLRIQSSCLFSETLNATDCDCKLQLDESMRLVEQAGCGIIVYLYQEGRGAGLAKKIEAMELMRASGYDTAEAFAQLGLDADSRNYDLAIEMLKDLKASNSLRLISNNPRKYKALIAGGYEVEERISLSYRINPTIEKYLRSKEKKLSHTIDWGKLL